MPDPVWPLPLVAGAGLVTLGIDICIIKLVLSHAAAAHGLDVSAQEVDLARTALKRLGLIAKGAERDRRPTQDELEELISTLDENPRNTMPMGRIVKFEVAIAMRQEEICRVTWGDVDARTRMLTIRDRRDPRQKRGNDQRILPRDNQDESACCLTERCSLRV